MLGYADRVANYLHQPGGHRVHPLGSEGGLTSQQRRRARKKMARRKRAALLSQRRTGD